ncbi:CdaR family protein [Halalkalibacterium ligniniphilum]|uniref:CdaR family protein n=1 Tax=Halalkalibacterium ligniniphilum TaxID=1134413 RepID=UPI00034DE9BE|nr:YbbR-like domain-containing protein [Halalkalibacterium ligniniphilum]
MDKLFNSHWFVKIISFFLALMLFTMVNLDNISNQAGILPQVSTTTYTLEDVELTVLYDQERFEIVDQTEAVQVSLRGPRSDLTVFQVTRPSYEVYVDLTEREEGTHTVQVQHRGFPSDLAVTIVPEVARVELQEKQTVSLPVTVDIINEDKVQAGYSVGTPIVTPVNIEVTAARDFVNQVSMAKVYIDVTDASGPLEEAAPVKLYDHQGNELHLDDIEPSVVDVRVPITSPNKEVPVRITRQRELPEGLSIDSLTVEPREVKVYGPQNVLDDLSVIEGIQLDLSKLTESQTIELAVPLPRGAERVEPERVSVTVELAEQEELEMNNVPIDVIGAAEDLKVSFSEGSTDSVDLVLLGTEEILNRLTREDIQVYIDVNDLSEGTHTVPLQFNGPQNVEFQSNVKEIDVTIAARDD